MGAFTYGALVQILAQLERATFRRIEISAYLHSASTRGRKLHTRGLPWASPHKSDVRSTEWQYVHQDQPTALPFPENTVKKLLDQLLTTQGLAWLPSLGKNSDHV